LVGCLPTTNTASVDPNTFSHLHRHVTFLKQFNGPTSNGAQVPLDFRMVSQYTSGR
jgi:hypothetical protein